MVLSVGVAAPAHAAPTGFPPPVTGDLIPLSSLPLCSTLNNGTFDAVGLGWTGAFQTSIVGSAFAQQFALTMPCKGTTGLLSYALVYRNHISGTNPGTSGLLPLYGVVACYNGGVRVDYDLSATPGTPASTFPQATNSSGWFAMAMSGTQIGPAAGARPCEMLHEIRLSVPAIQGMTLLPPSPARWTPSTWRTDASGWKPATSAAQLLPDGVELPIVCEVDNSGADIFEIFQNFFGSIAALPGCLFIPVGWDRADLIGAEWERGPPGEVRRAFASQFPAGITCGLVMSLELFGTVLHLNTCDYDIAPSIVKHVVGYVMILGIGVLAYKRILWAVGSKG